MAIREELVLDSSKYRRELDNTNRATIKYARKQERLHKQNKQSLQAIQTELKRLRAVREASNNPKAVRKYTDTIEKLEKEQKQLRKETEKYEGAVKKTSKTSESAFKKIGRSAKLWLAGAAAGALLYIGSLVRDMGGEMMRFNEEMNKSLAIQGNVTMEQRNRMEKAAKEVSRELNLATDKVAKGYFYLASAGQDVEEQIANLPKVAEFAKAGMFDLATATDLATDAQSALGLTAENTAQNQQNLVRVTDVLVSANQQANATVQQFSEALTNKGATALRNVNKEVEEGVAVLAAYADQGIKGNRAGEYLSRTLRIMSRAANENIEQFKELGIVTAEGNLADFPTIIEALTEELGGLSDTAMTAKLEQMGFTSEVQEAIKPLIGLSDEVANYETNLRQAAGSTEEVANKQLKSLTERLGLLKRQLVDTFGDDVVSAIESTVNALESLYRAVRGTQQEIQKERVIEGALEDIGGLYGSDLSGIGFTNLRTELDKLYDSQRKNTEEFNRQNRELKETISSYSTWASEVEGAEEKVQSANEELLFREMVLKKNIEQNKELIKSEETSVQQKAKLIVKNQALSNKLSSVQDQISKTRDYLSQTTEEEEEQQDQVEGLANSYAKALRKFGEFEDHLNQIVMLGRQISGSELGGLPTIISDVNEQFNKLSQGNVVGAISDVAVGKITQYNRELTKLNNEYSAGIISQKEYERQLQKLSDSFLSQLQEMYKSIKDDLTPAQQELWKELFGNFDEGSDATEDFKGNLDDIADTADAILNVADAFGAIGENARKSLRGISDVLRNAQKLKELQGAGELTALSGAMPAIGVAGGVLSMISGIVGNSGMSSSEIKELENEMKSLVRALDKNTEAILEQAQIGADVSQSQLQQAQDILSQLEGVLTGSQLSEMIDIDFPTGSFEGEVSKSFIEEVLSPLFDQLSETGIPGLEDLDSDAFIDIVKGIAGENISFAELEEALDGVINGMEDFEGISDVIETLENRLGEFGDSLEGAIERFNITTQLGGDPGEAFDRFIQDVIGLVGEDNKVTDLLEQIAEAESPEARKELANQLWEAFQDNPALLGSDLTGSDLQEIIDMILGQESASGSEASGEGFSRSVQIARTITDVQANEMIMFLERIEKWTRDMAAGMGSKTAQSVNSSGGMMPSFDIQVPLPVTIVDDMPEGGGTMIDQRSRVTKQFNFNGPIDIGGDVTEQDIDDLTRQFNRRLKQSLRGSQF